MAFLFAMGVSMLPGRLVAAAQNNAPQLSPVELVRQAINNEVASNSSSGRHFMFKDTKKTAHLNQVKLVVETRDATAGMLIANDGRPLSPQERKQEEARLSNYVQNPQELNKKRKQEKEDADHTMRILKALPDAFLYEPDGTEAGTAVVGHAGDELVRLKFRPNPNYDPPTRTEQVLTGMQGYLLIDATEKRLAEINATLFREVGFGWGILGHLDRGGRFLVEQADVGGRNWEITHMELSFTGKILLLKKLSIQSTDTFSDFHPVPSDLTFAQGVELLKKQASQADASTSDKAKPVHKKNGSAEEKAEAESKQICCDR
ncbi:MAG TPA: hypothetical protein VN682_14825 [Terriglobales bacterium]|nr:hypothetical protein [Terriglobales bacterium]